MHNVFVYGTLKRGFPNHATGMKSTAFVGRFRTCGRFALVLTGPWYSPVMIDEPGVGHRVAGEVFAVGDAELGTLDRLEGTDLPSGYHRTQIEVENIETGAVMKAWTYVKRRAQIEVVLSAPMDEYSIDPRYVPPSRRNM